MYNCMSQLVSIYNFVCIVGRNLNIFTLSMLIQRIVYVLNLTNQEGMFTYKHTLIFTYCTASYFATGSADALTSLWDVSEFVCIRTFTRLELSLINIYNINY